MISFEVSLLFQMLRPLFRCSRCSEGHLERQIKSVL